MELKAGIFHLKPSLRKEVCIDRAMQVECLGRTSYQWMAVSESEQGILSKKFRPQTMFFYRIKSCKKFTDILELSLDWELFIQVLSSLVARTKMLCKTFTSFNS